MIKWSSSSFYSLLSGLMILIANTAYPQDPCPGEKAALSNAAIDHNRVNFFYTLVKNPIDISIPGYCPKQIKANLSIGELTKKKPGKYIAKVPDSNETVLTILVTMKNGKTKKVETRKFDIQSLPPPEPYLKGMQDDKILLKKFKAADSLRLRHPEHLLMEDIAYEVAQYRVTYVPAKGAFREAKVKEAALPEHLKKQIAKAGKAGDKIIFDRIMVNAPFGKISIPNALIVSISGPR